MKTSKAIRILTFALPTLVAISVIIIAVISFSLEEPPLSLNGAADFNSGWSKKTSSGSLNITLPLTTAAENGTIVISNTLPDKLDRNAVLGVKVLYQKLKVYVGGKEIYEMGYKDKAPFGSAYGYLWSFIPLRDEYAGQIITLSYVSPFTAREMGIEGILIGNESAIFMRIINSNIILLVLCGLLLIVGVFYLVIRLILQYKYPTAIWSGLTYLTIFFFLVILWLFTDSDLTQFIPGWRAFCYLASFYSFMLLPIPFLRFLDEISSEKRKALFVLTVLFSINVIICTLLYVLNILDLIQSIYSTHLLMLISLVIGGGMCAKEIKRANATIRDIAIGTVCLFVGSFISIIQFYFYITDATLSFKYSLIVFVFFISKAAIKRYFLMLNESISAAAYKKLAYTDSLSGLGSRTAFSEAVELLQENKEKHESIAFIVFDIDNLKPVNDSLGHIKGDELIKAVARCLDDVFSGMGQCFRIGGDEFAAIIADIPEAEINEQLKILKHLISESSDETTGKIGLSIGFEFCKKDAVDSFSIYEIFGRADAEMYKNKKTKERLARQ